MPDFQRITIENIEYFIVDSIQNLRAEEVLFTGITSYLFLVVMGKHANM